MLDQRSSNIIGLNAEKCFGLALLATGIVYNAVNLYNRTSANQQSFGTVFESNLSKDFGNLSAPLEIDFRAEHTVLQSLADKD